MKLSKTQVAILRRLDGGAVLEYVGPPIDRFVFAGNVPPHPRKRSVEILVDCGLVKSGEDVWWGKTYAITDKGREYLEERCEETH